MRNMAWLIALLVSFSIIAQIQAYDPVARAQQLVANMTLDEKILMLHGSPGPYTGHVPANTRLGIPALNMNDGPQGFRGASGTSTAWPSGLTVAATWDVEAVGAWGTAMGKEFYQKGANVQLGPGLCVARVPTNGRNFEYASGEDPFLGYTLVQPLIKGIQSQGVIANAKHYVNNNQETNRHGVSENVDERTRFEMYYPPFEGAIEAGVGSFMCSYNLINGRWSCENNATLATDLKVRLNPDKKYFWVMSDWGATHSPSINQGLDQEMPRGDYMNQTVKAMVQNGTVSQARLDASIMNMLVPMIQVGLFENQSTGHAGMNVTSPEHTQLARELSANSTVLLQNRNNILPLNANSLQTIAVIGEQAGPNSIVHGGGSGHVDPSFVLYPLAGIKTALGFKDPFNVDNKDCSDDVCVVYVDGSNNQDTVEAASQANVTLVFAATSSSEGRDRTNLSLAGGQDDYITLAAAHSEQVVAVISTPGAILMPWSEDVDAILINFMPGLQAGNAVADVLFGKVNPNAKLPLTMPNIENEIGFTTRQYPGLDDAKEAYYDEKLLVGYRWYDYHNIEPKFPFGHGLSYTTFNYSSLSISGRTLTFNVQNLGRVGGAEVAQLYLGFPLEANEPPRQLKGFQKVYLHPGQTQEITMTLRDRDLSIWDADVHAWKVLTGEFDVYVGSSSNDIRLTGQLSN
eukprot:TRINITY_DN12646_c4_g1_i1.p1 TRINITY_DN12646_c4_g1~~TRINITY_DN12646_c4_g1_i1.p1  ORF type:complete len:687 (+),score=167.95 TRINITY_DN12646_c4_g1_i1:2334-4394(+)